MELMTVADVLWLAVLAYWIISASMVKQNMQRENLGRRIFHLSFITAAILLDFVKYLSLPWLNYQLLPQTQVFKLFGFCICVLGLFFAVWARTILGKNWSGRIAIKEGQELINYGPYAITRHPIYTGLITGFIGMALLRGDVRGCIAAALVCIAFPIKIHREENTLRTAFGKKYTDYSKKVKQLIPFIY